EFPNDLILQDAIVASFSSILWQTEVPDRFWDPRRELKVLCSCHSIARTRPRSVVGEYSYDPAKRERRMCKSDQQAGGSRPGCGCRGFFWYWTKNPIHTIR